MEWLILLQELSKHPPISTNSSISRKITGYRQFLQKNAELDKMAEDLDTENVRREKKKTEGLFFYYKRIASAVKNN